MARWLMTLGTRPRPDTPSYAECPGPDTARAVALADDFAQLFPILLEWRETFGDSLTGWAAQVEADDIEHLPADIVRNWGPDQVRLDTMPGGYVKVSDRRDTQASLTAAPARTRQLTRP
ncbi:hypothetical protein [Streptomyces sp. V3I7]|uniref:hypothetical protein n=1 Tax=Streptomyces sp. V3I7 TaxID=3042278 RepID=UPI00277D290D|nr:hypothetical protein [Streptomyces sp. V3I7]MDQ0994813.1 hypothetical protein [Streptomyces sp. V3I7]